MRNLKKILALVLALVMSLSLMATVSAADFTDKADINPEYQAAADVLNGLNVFKGYQDGSFQPKGDITRAEVATIIYRIATADVTDAQAGIYTTWGKFDDVKDTSWYAGYVNYCANAGIVKGKTATTFKPEDRITGYQVLAMILRTMGYGKNGEFEGDNWAINTAAQAKALGIIDGVTENLLGSNATREFVAQILFKAMLTDMVDYSVLEGYKPNGKTLAKERFGMERIEGVVVANEYADLRDDDVMDEGKTVLRVADGDTTRDITMNVSTDLNDIGESRYAYVVSDGKRSNNLVTGELYNTGRNVTPDTGDAATVSSYASKNGLSVSGAQHFVNFDYEIVGESEYRIEYQVSFDNNKYYDKQTAQEWFEEQYGVDPADVIDDSNRRDVVKVDPLDARKVTYTRVIPMGDPITVEDVAIMKGIFSAADDDIHSDVGVKGYVYAGTAQGKDQHDLSSEMSWRAFQDEYLVSKADTEVKSTANGEWLKIIDNDNDGVAEYVFRTKYALAEITGYDSRRSNYLFSGNKNESYLPDIDLNVYDVNYGDYEPAIGDVVLGALIDGVWQIELAPMETRTIQTVDFKNKNIITTDGDTWDQSDISNKTEYAEDILVINQKTEYEIFFDKFGHVRAYRTTAGAADYALLSELYFENQYNTAIIKNYTPIVEITIQDAKTTEMPVSNVSSTKNSVFDGIGVTITDSRGRQHTDYLQRAINHLGVDNANLWKDQLVSYVDKNGNKVYRNEFQWNDAAKWDDRVSETNVAVYNLTDDGDSVALATASAFKYDRQNQQLFYSDLDKDGNPLVNAQYRVNAEQYYALYYKSKGITTPTSTDKANAKAAFDKLHPVFDIDYVQLDLANGLKGGDRRYDIHAGDCSYNLYYTLVTPELEKYDGNYVNATHNTQYYIVSIGSDGRANNASWFTDYAKVPTIKAGDITAAYAVASNTTNDVDGRDYWVAEVIVIETKGTESDYDSVALAYYSPDTSTGGIRNVEALDNMTKDPAVDLSLTAGWYYGDNNVQWNGYGFYDLYDTEVDEPDVKVGSYARIPNTKTGDYDDHHIKAAIVTRDHRVKDEGEYLMVDYTGHRYGKYNEVPLTVKSDVKVYGIFTQKEIGDHTVYELEETDKLYVGDEIILVYNKSGSSLSYIVITNYVTENHVGEYYAARWSNAWWLEDEYTAILDEQNYVAPEKRTLVPLTFELDDGEAAVVTYVEKGYDDQVVTADSENPTVKIWVSDDTNFTFNLKAKVVALVSDEYNFHPTSVADADDEWNVTAQLKSAVPQSLSDDGEDEPESIATAYTEAAVTQMIKDVFAKKTDLTKANELTTKLLGIVKNLVPGAAAIEVKGKDGETAKLDTALVDAVVDVKVDVFVEEYKKNNDGEAPNEELLGQIETAMKNAVDEAVKNDELDTVAEVDKAVEAAVEEIKDAVDAGVNPADELAKEKTALTNAITDAEDALKADLPTGVTAAAAADAKAALTAAIEDAKAALAAEDATKESLTTAKETLDTAVVKYQKAIEALKPSTTEKVTVTLQASEGIVIASATDAKGNKATAGTNGDYTIDSDTELTVVLTITSEDVDENTTITVKTADGNIVEGATVDVNVQNKTAKITIPAAKASVTYKFELTTKASTNNNQ